MNSQSLFSKFDEAEYLHVNPDVEQAIGQHRWSSGWAHYLLLGHREDRAGVSADVRNCVATLMRQTPQGAIPPTHLRLRVHGDENPDRFNEVGQQVSTDLYAAISPHLDLSADLSILDFGCGCGRVMRHLQRFTGRSRIQGTDIDTEAISWCRDNLASLGVFETNGDLPPLPFESRTFDFVYVVSVFTHLPEDMQFSWLTELRRVTRPGGYVVISIHGADIVAQMPDEVQRQFRESGYAYTTIGTTPGLPDYYQVSFHSPVYIHNQWTRYFTIETVLERGINFHQDLVLCRRLAD